jgi:predicted nuclease of predicted toxin-antitoxin system
MKFFFDNNLSPHLCRAMNELAADEEGDQFVHAREKGMDAMKDPDLIGALAGEGGWVIVTTDVAMSKSPHMVRALASSGLICVSLRHGWLEMGGMRMASQLLKRWADIRSMVLKARPATVVVVPPRGKILIQTLARKRKGTRPRDSGK